MTLGASTAEVTLLRIGNINNNWHICAKRTNKMHFSFLIYFDNISSTCFNTVTVHNQQAGTVYAHTVFIVRLR